MTSTETPVVDLPSANGVKRLRRRKLERETHQGLQHPLMSLPATLYIVGALLVPLGVLIVYSFWPSRNGFIIHHWTFGNYTRFFTQSIYPQLLFRTFWLVGLAALSTVVLTYPFAYYVATKVRPNRRIYWVLIAMIPFFTSYLIRVFAWMSVYGDTGLLNTALLRMHLIHQPLAFLSFTRWDVVITFVYLLFPLSFFSTYIAIERINPTLWEAAADLGAKPWRSTMRVTIPLIRSGLLAAFAFCFISMLGDYATPTLIGGTDGTLFSNIIVNQFGSSVEWGFGAALAVIMLLAVLVMLVALRVASGSAAAIGEYTMKYQHRRSRAGLAYSVLFVVFLYVPIALLVLLAFNDSSTAGLPIQGFTLNWFTTVFHDSILLSALRTSLRVAAISVGCGLLLGSIAAVQLARGRGALRNLSIGIVSLPLLLPPVVLGLAIIIATQWLGLQRGMWTIIVGHILITLPVIVLLLIVRLEGLDPNVELAAMDLGARPWQTFLRISVPQALPAIIAAGMIAFALSMDEFIMTFLITGSQTTLPLYIWGSIRFVITPELNALSTLMLGMSFVLLLGGALIGFGRGRVIRRAA